MSNSSANIGNSEGSAPPKTPAYWVFLPGLAVSTYVLLKASPHASAYHGAIELALLVLACTWRESSRHLICYGNRSVLGGEPNYRRPAAVFNPPMLVVPGLARIRANACMAANRRMPVRLHQEARPES